MIKMRLVFTLAVASAGSLVWGQNQIAVSPTSLAFCVAANSTAQPLPQTLTVSANTSNAQSFSVQASQSWIIVTPLPATVTPGEPPAIISVQVNPAAVSASSTGNITLV